MFFSYIVSLFILLSCSKKDSPGVETILPANLNVVANVSTDNSGNVSFIATADNAASYEYDFGNGIFQSVIDGRVTYKYPGSGSYTVKVTAKSRTGQTISRSIDITVAVALSLVWSDEFNVDGAPDATKWNYDIGTGSNGWGNNELQYYTNRPENAVVSGGTLRITARREAFSGSAFTSARLLTKGKFSTKYGKIEVRAKLPTGVGTWPAIWMLGSNIDQAGWPGCGEIDIMEHKGSEENRIHGTLHYPARFGGNADGNSIMVPNVATTFNVYTAEWNASSIRIFANGNLIHSFNNNPNVPFNHDFFILLNVAMGGGFGGPVAGGFQQSTMEVDYVRVYN